MHGAAAGDGNGRGWWGTTAAQAELGGFTLLELMIVVLLLGIFAGLALPEFGGTREEANLRAAARELVSTLRLARSEAVTSRSEHRFHLDASEHLYWIEVARVDERGELAFEPLDSIALESTADDGRRARTGRRPPNSGDLEVTVDLEVRELLETLDRDPEAMPEEPRAELLPPGVVAFRADGTADPTEIVLRDRAGFGLAVRVRGATGRVELVELGRERP